MSIQNLLIPNNYDLFCEDLSISGTATYAGDVNITGNLNVTPGEIRTDVIQIATPNSALVIQQNGIGNILEVELPITRMNAVECNIIDSKVALSPLQLGGSNASSILINDDLSNLASNFIINSTTGDATFGNIEATGLNGVETNVLNHNGAGNITLQTDLIPPADNSGNLGYSAQRYSDVNSVWLHALNLTSTSGSGQDLSLSADSGVVNLAPLNTFNFGNNNLQATGILINGSVASQINCNVLRSFTANQDLLLDPDGTGNVSISSNCYPASSDAFQLGNNANRWVSMTALSVETNAVNESTPTNGVSVDNLLIKDGMVQYVKTALVTQLTDLTTAVTSNGVAGSIQTVSSTLGANTSATFTVNNSSMLATNFVELQLVSYSGTQGGLVLMATNFLAGSFDVTVRNTDPALAQDGVIVFTYYLY